jgi:hypothetical protein
MARIGLCLVSLLFPSLLWAQACIIHSEGQQTDVLICQHNRNIPQGLFKNGFCQPHLAGKKVEVKFAEQCPAGAFGACRAVQVSNTPYRQDIYYYGVATDARFLQPYCVQQNRGQWVNLQ